MSAQPTYRFKWSNMDLPSYIETIRFKAQKLRRDAATLIAQAEAIEEVAGSLSIDLEIATPGDDDA